MISQVTLSCIAHINNQPSCSGCLTDHQRHHNLPDRVDEKCKRLPVCVQRFVSAGPLGPPRV